MRIDVKAEGLEKVQGVLRQMSGPQIRQAMADGINDAAARAQRVMEQRIISVFDRPSHWVTQSVWVDRATPDNLSARITPTYARGEGTTGGKSGVDPQKILQAQEFGGRRADKKSEIALRRADILPRGYQTAIPDDDRGGPYPGSTDRYGNISGAFMQHLLSYLRAYSEVGFQANMSDKTRRAVHRGRGKRAGRRYIVAYGDLRSGTRLTKRGDYDQRVGNLDPGIYAIEGGDVHAVLIFMKSSKGYVPRISMERIAQDAGGDAYLATRIRRRVYNLAENLGLKSR